VVEVDRRFSYKRTALRANDRTDNEWEEGGMHEERIARLKDLVKRIGDSL